MYSYTTTILKFGKQGEKSGWTYIEVPADVAQELLPGNKKSFRVKGKLDNYSIQGVALLPMGKGDFIMPLNLKMRKGFGKRYGAMLQVQLEVDVSAYILNADLMACLNDEPKALAFFKKLATSHQNYFSKWIDSAKTDATKAKRITQTVNALSKNQGFPEMMRLLKNN